MTDNLTQEETPDFLQESSEFEAHLLNLETSIVFKGRTLVQWNEHLAIPTVSVTQDISVSQLEQLHAKALNTIETVMSNLAIARSAFIAAKSNHEVNLLRSYRDLSEEFSNSTTEGRRKPSNEYLNKLCEVRCLKTFKIYAMSDLLYNFWNTQSYKLNQLNERLTSLNYTKRN